MTTLPEKWYRKVWSRFNLVTANCKFCACPFPSYRVLRRHVEKSHPYEFLKVALWLGKTVDLDVEHYTRLAKEGLLGHKEKRDT